MDHLVPCDDLIPDSLISGKPDNFRNVAKRLEVPILGELPLVEGVSTSGDGGYPFVLGSVGAVKEAHGTAGAAWRDNMLQVAKRVASTLWTNPDVAKKVRYYMSNFEIWSRQTDFRW